MINVDFVKNTTTAVTCCCASYVAGTIIGNLCPAASPIMKVVTVVGGGAIGGMIGNAAGEYTGNVIGDLCECINEAQKA